MRPLAAIGDWMDGLSVRTGRRMEWYTACTTFGWGVMFLMPGSTFEIAGVFGAFFRRGVEPGYVGIVFCIAGTAWLLGLWSNGHWHQSPTIRVAGALAGATIWGWVGASLVVETLITGVINPGAVTYSLMALFNLDAAYVAARDMEWGGRRRRVVDF